MGTFFRHLALLGALLAVVLPMQACALAGEQGSEPLEQFDAEVFAVENDILQSEEEAEAPDAGTCEKPVAEPDIEAQPQLDLAEDYREAFAHGDKGAAHQKYIVLHDTESETPPEGIVDYWDGNGNLVAAHFVVGVDGHVVQCVPLDKIAHHAGYGDAGHNALFGVEDESRDDMLGTVPIGDWACDYGMNGHSVGIELVHVGGSGAYPEAQLDALDALIAYIDGYYGFESDIIDHKAWRTGNSDTSPEFASYLESYQRMRTHEA